MFQKGAGMHRIILIALLLLWLFFLPGYPGAGLVFEYVAESEDAYRDAKAF